MGFKYVRGKATPPSLGGAHGLTTHRTYTPSLLATHDATHSFGTSIGLIIVWVWQGGGLGDGMTVSATFLPWLALNNVGISEGARQSSGQGRSSPGWTS